MTNKNSKFSVGIPESCPYFQPTELYRDLIKAIESERWFSGYIVGPTGVGKTLPVLQACLATDRICTRIQIHESMEPYDLFGGHRLFEGNTVFHEGPFVQAWRSGHIILLDEIDFANPKITASLHGAMEGTSLRIPETDEIVPRHPLCQVFMTANTKGTGNTGDYYGTQHLNSAFRGRAMGVWDVSWMPEKAETTALIKYAKSIGINESGFEKIASDLVVWAGVTRVAAENNMTTPAIHTRCLTHIVTLYAIYGDIEKALNLGLGMNDSSTREGLIKAYRDAISLGNAKAQPASVA